MVEETEQEAGAEAAQGAEAEPGAADAAPPTSGGEPEEPQDEEAPGEYLRLKDAQQITYVWKVEHQHVGVQQMGPVFGGHAHGAGTAAVATERMGVDGVSPVRGRIRTSELERLRRIHVPTPVQDWAIQTLKEFGLAVLYGRARWGKTTSALRLLDEQHPNEVYLLDPAVPLDALEGTGLGEGTGYILERPAPAAATALRLETLVHLSERLLELKSHLVITIDGVVPVRRHTLRQFLVPCDELPDAKLVLDRSLGWRLRDLDPPVDKRKLASPEWVGHQLEAGLVPARVDGLASVLERVARRELAATDAASAYRELLAEQVAEWFENHPGLHERCLMVAIGLLNGGSYQEVADAADKLAALLEPSIADEEKPRAASWPLTSSRRTRVQDCCASLVIGLESTEIGEVPVEAVRLEDPNLQPAVLDHVWREHDDTRSALLDWLEELGAQSSLSVSGRIAAAAGSLAQHDLRYFHDRLFVRWARHDQRGVRWSAAVALDVLAAAGDEADQRVRRLLHHWVSSDPRSSMAWTAVAAYGLEIGQRHPAAALDDLLLVIRGSPRALWIAGQTIANLCDVGLAAVALKHLTDWSQRRNAPLLQERSLRVFLHATRAVSTLGTTGRSGPVLLRNATDEADSLVLVTSLWQSALAHERIEFWARDSLRRWLDHVEETPTLEPALDALVASLLGLSGRTQPIMRRLLAEWASDPVHPSALAAHYLS